MWQNKIYYFWIEFNFDKSFFYLSIKLKMNIFFGFIDWNHFKKELIIFSVYSVVHNEAKIVKKKNKLKLMLKKKSVKNLFKYCIFDISPRSKNTKLIFLWLKLLTINLFVENNENKKNFSVKSDCYLFHWISVWWETNMQ